MIVSKKRGKLRPYTRQFYRGNRWRLAVAVLQTLLMTGANLLLSWLLQMVVDLASGVNVGFSFGEILLLELLGAFLSVSAYAAEYISKPGFIAKAISQYKEYVFAQMCRKGISAFSGENTALYTSALSNDAAAIETNYLTNIFTVIENTVLCIGALALMFWYSPLLTVVSIGLSMLSMVAAVLTGNSAAKAEKQVSDTNEAYMSTLKDSLVGFSVVKSFRAEAQMCRLFAEKVREVGSAKSQRMKIGTLVNMLASCTSLIVQFGVFMLGAYLVLSGSGLTAGSVLVFVQLLNYVLWPVRVIPQAFAGFKSSRALIEKAADALADNVREEGTSEKITVSCGITLNDVSFEYEAGKPVLQDISFMFEAGKSYAVVGASGSGKSTLLNLLMASSHNYVGSIRYDDTELREIGSAPLYDAVSVVQQNVFIFNASIRDNITMFNAFPEEEVEKAIRLSGLSVLVADRGTDYLCGENGSGLSGGEKQRISIARSLLKKSRVLLVDEATAALDTQTAFQVSDAILNLNGMTRIVVTHTLDKALLQRYDCILTLKNGRIAECGSFDDLMDEKGYFYSLYTVSQ